MHQGHRPERQLHKLWLPPDEVGQQTSRPLRVPINSRDAALQRRGDGQPCANPASARPVGVASGVP